MNKEEIKTLLTLFADGQTTEAEERQLADYFCKEQNVPREWQAYKILFNSLQNDDYNFTAHETALLGAEKTEKRLKPVYPYWLAAVAACLIIAFIIGGKNLHKEPSPSQAVTTLPLAKQNDRPSTVAKNNSHTDLPEERLTLVSSRKKIIIPASKPEDIAAQQTENDDDETMFTDKPAETIATSPPAAHLASVNPENTQPEAHVAVYSEADLPVTNPQNLAYTEEEIEKIQQLYKQRFFAQMREQIDIATLNLKQLEALIVQK